MTWTEKKLIDLSRLRLREYSRCFLRRNPFPSTAIPEEVPPVTVDRDSIIRHFQDVVAQLYQDGASTVTVLVGEYGSGKSHLLKVFKHSTNSQLLQLEEPSLAVYIKSPGRNFLDFVFAVIEDLGRSLLTDYSNRVIEDFISQHWSRSEHYIYDSEVREEFKNKRIGIDSLLRSSTTRDLFSDIKHERFSGVRNFDLVSAFLFLSHPDFSSIAWRWFLGQKLSREERDEIVVDSALTEPKEAYSVFQSLVELLHLLGVKSLVLLIDELEKIVLISALLRSQYQDDLRHLIDDNPKAMGVFFAIAGAQWNLLTREPTALQRRLAGNIYLLDRFDERRIKDLIAAYLDQHRTEGYSPGSIRRRFPHCPAELCPFTEESVNVILEKSDGTLSSVIMLCRKALDYFLDHVDDYEAITGELVASIAK